MCNTVHRARQVEEGIHNELTFVQRFNIIPNSIRFNYCRTQIESLLTATSILTASSAMIQT